MTEPLKSCPFCGGTDVATQPTEPHGAYVIKCKCGAKGPDAPCRDYEATGLETYKKLHGEASEKAARLWNVRV